MSIPILFEIYDYTNDRCFGLFEDYDEAQVACDEYTSNYGQPVEALVQVAELEPAY